MKEILKIENLTFSWADKPLLKIDGFEMEKGKTAFVFGPSGSGKSTFLNLLAGMIVPDSGSISILGKEVTRFSEGQRDQFRGDHMGFLFQDFSLIPYLDAVENVLLPLRFSSLKSQRVKGAESAEAGRLLKTLSVEDVNRPVSELSVGQQQRVGAARALIGRPELLIADEPTSALDEDVKRDFLKLLFSECRESGSSLLFVSHDHRLAEAFDTEIPLMNWKPWEAQQ